MIIKLNIIDQHHHDHNHYSHLNDISPPFGSNSPVLVIVKMDVPRQGALMMMIIIMIVIVIIIIIIVIV